MTHWKSMHESEYLTAVEFNGRTPTWTIVMVKAVPLPVLKKGKDTNPNEPPKERSKPVVFFKEVDRGLVLNKTNGPCFEAMFGADVEGWANKRVTLQAEPVQVGPKKELGIRVVGSPDITKPIKVTIEHPRKRPVDVVMQPTGKQPARTPGQDDGP
jgi:hypothetical protein